MSDSEGDWLEVVEETRRALQATPDAPPLLLKQGQAYFHLDEFETALKVLGQGLALAQASPADEDKALAKKFEMWVRKCRTHLDPAPAPPAGVPTAPAAPAASAESSGGCADPAPSPVPPPADTPSSSAAAAASSAPVAAPGAPSIRFEWFQSNTHLTVTFFCKDRTAKDVDVEYGTHSLLVAIKLGGGKEFQQGFGPLYGEVDPKECNHTVGKYKLEISLKKSKEGQWAALEKVGAPPPAAGPPPPGATYPSSRPVKKDWDKLTAEITALEKDEKEEGDAALNKLFRDIYSRADENTRRAMNKSFVESGGTVLSTNWSEVGAKQVECTPPKGMELKKPGE